MRNKNESRAALVILKSPEKEYNANSLSRAVGITSMGMLKILKKLEEEGILVSRKVSNMNLYRINFSSPYAMDYAAFLLKDEVEHSSSYVKRWVLELRKIKEADIAIIFGSALRVGEEAEDIDVLLMVKKGRFGGLREEIKRLNLLNEKKIHPVFQTKQDLLGNTGKGDSAVLGAIKGIVVSGEKEFVKLLGRVK